MKNIITFILILLCAECGFVKASEAPATVDSTVVIFNDNESVLSCRKISCFYTFKLELGEYQAEIVFMDVDGAYWNDNIYLNKKSSEGNASEAPVIPYLTYKVYTFSNGSLCSVNSNVKKTREWKFMEDYPSAEHVMKYWRYEYDELAYSIKNHQMLGSGKISVFFANVSDLCETECNAHGMWKVFEKPVLKGKQIAGQPHFNNVITDLGNESKVFDKNVRWSLTKDEFIIEFGPGDGETLTWGIELKGEPCVKYKVQKTAERVMEYTFAPNGRPSLLVISDNSKSDIYRYDTESGCLISKQIVAKDSPKACVEETYDINKEYREMEVTSGYFSNGALHFKYRD